MTRYLVTSALPYANGPVHFGHAVGAYLPADVYVRTLRMQGEEALFVCGGDEHGVAITLRAESEGVPYADYVARWRDEIKRTFDRLGIEFDVWSGTSISPHHAELSQEFFTRLDDNGYLVQKDSEQLFCPRDEMFLADRYVVGTCPKCGHENARGDECPNCGSWLDPLTLVEPACKLCGTAPERRTTRHWYLDMPKLRDTFIGGWIGEHEWKPNVAAFIQNMLEDVPLRAITRDLKWGVPVPEAIADGESGKVIYVWFDAPIGYVSFTREWAEAQGTPDAWKDWWRSPDTRLVHFIGKDNIPFHCMLFPAMLWGVQQDYVLPWQVPANEFYNLQGAKFSTSDNWTIPLDRHFESYDAEVTRFYLIASMPETADSEWRWEEFARHANLLADKIGNLVTRTLKMIGKNFDGCVPPIHEEHRAELDRALLEECGPIADPGASIRAFRFRRAAEELLANAQAGNVFVDRFAPWTLRKEDPQKAESVLSTACQWQSWLARWMAPFMPEKAAALWSMLGETSDLEREPWPGLPESESWRRLPVGQALGDVRGLFDKIDDETVAREIDALTARAR